MKKFTLELKSEEVEIGDEVYVIKELNGRQRDFHANTLGKRAILNDKGKIIGMKEYGGESANLLSLTMTKEDKPVLLATIQKWPSQVIADLAVIAKKLSGLEDEPEEEVKND